MALFKKIDIPLVWLTLFLVLGLLARNLGPDFFGPDFFGSDFLGLSPWLIWVGSALLLMSVVIILYSSHWFRKQSTGIMPNSIPRKLIIQGPYVFSRNPIYLAMALGLLALLLILSSVLSLLCVPVFMWVIKKRFILWEERTLVETFGIEAEHYLANTRRWL
ncbi:MAG: methyltransferase family protein [Alphaproteobacteria bacterium]